MKRAEKQTKKTTAAPLLNPGKQLTREEAFAMLKADAPRLAKQNWRQIHASVFQLFSMATVMRHALSGLTDDGSNEESIDHKTAGALLGFADTLLQEANMLRDEYLCFENNMPAEMAKLLH